jgi:NADH-quinone oxidoreductase subunit E
MSSAPFIIETALLLLVTYVIGCVIGDFARRLSLGEARRPQIQAPVDADAPKPIVAEPVKLVETQRIPAAEATKPVELAAGAMLASPPAVVAQPATIAPVVEPAEVVAPARPKRTPRSKQPAPVPLAVPVSDGKPPALAAPRGGNKDDLRQIKGIGPKIESLLNDLGVFHFDQIAAWDAATSAWIDAHLGFKGRVGRENWIAQAKAKCELEEKLLKQAG